MRLIDADKLQKAIPAEEDNITGMGMTYEAMEAYNAGIDKQWKKIVNAPTVKAIPMEWIKSWAMKSENTYNREQIIEMLNDWEKENEAD